VWQEMAGDRRERRPWRALGVTSFAVGAVGVVAAVSMAWSDDAVAGSSTAACKPSPRPYSTAAPAKELLSVVGVLREPATGADRTYAREFVAAASAHPGRFGGSITFVNYFRLTRVADHVPYYLVPVIHGNCNGSETP
jgi:hypothetical protein